MEGGGAALAVSARPLSEKKLEIEHKDNQDKANAAYHVKWNNG
jgi:hypothetical protein